MKRIVIIVLDSVGVGALPDASRYGDERCNTLAHVAEAVHGLTLPNLAKLGLGNVTQVKGVPPITGALGAYGRLGERSAGKDTVTGHWEIAGIILDKPFPVFPGGFPQEVIEGFQAAVGRQVLGNVAASGTEIILRLGSEHLATGKPIVYTSADSVFQVAAHEEVIPVPELYRMCQIARERILTGPFAVGRVIARPFVGRPDKFERTSRRHDFALPPPGPTLLDQVQAAGYEVAAVGKIKDIFAGQGITRSISTENNMDGVDKTLSSLQEMPAGLVFTNLVDFDSKYGHRNNPGGYGRALEEFDRRVPELLEALGPDDALIITADHGCDPTTPGTDHTREYVPVMICGQGILPHTSLGTRECFADLGATVAEALGVPGIKTGESFYRQIIEPGRKNGVVTISN